MPRGRTRRGNRPGRARQDPGGGRGRSRSSRSSASRTWWSVRPRREVRPPARGQGQVPRGPPAEGNGARLQSLPGKEAAGTGGGRPAAANRKGEKEDADEWGERRERAPHLQGGRLPDGSRFEVRYDAALEQWSGSLTVPAAEGGKTGHLHRLGVRPLSTPCQPGQAISCHPGLTGPPRQRR